MKSKKYGKIASVSNKQCKICPYFDKDKSKPHNNNGMIENPSSLTYCKYGSKYVIPGDECDIEEDKLYIKKKLTCKNCNRKILTYYRPKDKSIDGLINPIYITYFDERGLNTEGLFAYRPREDKLIGLECSCGSDTRTKEIASKEKATFNNAKCPFKTEGV